MEGLQITGSALFDEAQPQLAVVFVKFDVVEWRRDDAQILLDHIQPYRLLVLQAEEPMSQFCLLRADSAPPHQTLKALEKSMPIGRCGSRGADARQKVKERTKLR